MRRPAPTRARARAVSLAVGLALVACAQEEPEPRAPLWTDLARLGEEAPSATWRSTGFDAGGRRFEVLRDDEGLWLRTSVDAEHWAKGELTGRFKVPLPVRPIPGVREQGSGIRLSDARGALADYGPNRLPSRLDEEFHAAPRSFATFRGQLYLQLADGDTPAETSTLDVAVREPVLEDGVARVQGTRFSGVGLSLLPGARIERRVDVPPASALRFATCVEPAWSEARDGASVRFRVRLEDRVLLDHTQRFDAEGTHAWHTLALPERGAKDARLSFEVEGDFAYSSFLAPTVGPREVGAPGARPWGATRPDLVVFLADTFRADNMTLYGGELGLTPNLDRFAQEARRFLRAWSPSTNTFPAHASLFTGLYPLQTGIAGHGSRMPDEVRTVAEILADHGYRTVALTDKGFVSRIFGMAQGFEYFDELRGDLQDTLTRTRDALDADDGRPLFLFVHTYRAHSPYYATPTTWRERGDELGLEGTFDEWNRTWLGALRRKEDPRELPEVRDAVAAMRRLYHGGVVDLDRKFGAFERDLRAHGILDAGYVLVTSDHGEAFLEHRGAFHSGPVFEEEVRVPLLLRGPGLEPGDVQHAASLVDVTPTLLALAGIDAGSALAGRSLLELDGDRPIFLFQCVDRPERSTVGLVDGRHKVLTSEAWLREDVVGRAYDLAVDPAERRDLASEGAASWPRELFERLGPRALELTAPLFDAEASNLDEAHREEMQALGYMGEE